MRNISTAVRGHYDDDRYMWAIIIRRFCDNPPPIPPTLAEAIATLVNATTLLAQNQNANQGRRDQNNEGETTYVDFTNTCPPVFLKVDEPLEVDDWRQTMEQKFDLLQCTKY
jgi:hypothetical protein